MRLDGVKVILDVKADILTENAKVRVAVVLPKALVCLLRRCGSPEDP